jgi:acyl carrier protein
VIVRESIPGNKQLVAYVVGNIDDIHGLKVTLRKTLPDPMIPTHFISLKEMPLTSNGKVDRKALSMLDVDVSSEGHVIPETGTQRQLAQLWSEVLHISVEHIGLNSHFFELGGNSLLILQLQQHIKRRFNVDLPIQLLFEHSTIERMTDAILGIQGKTVEAETKKLLLKDIAWKPERYCLESFKDDEMKNVLLTGANGFLGIHLLVELLSLTSANAYCLLRGATLVEAQSKLKSSLTKFGFKELSNSPRIIVLNGDLEKNNLSLKAEEIEKLASSIDTIIHNGAYVHHLHNYETLRPSNVLSTQWLLQFALTGRIKRLHYVSTIGVITRPEEEREYPIECLKLNKKIPDTNNGYILSKWMGEHLVCATGQETGLPVSIYRPDLISSSL